MGYDKPLPSPDIETRPYWDGCHRHQLLVQRCTACGHAQLYPRALCVRCHGDALAWERARGGGTVYSYTVIRRAPSPAFKADVPYVLAVVELDEGVRMMTALVGCPPEAVRIGLRVHVVFDDVTEDISLPKFEPAPASA